MRMDGWKEELNRMGQTLVLPSNADTVCRMSQCDSSSPCSSGVVVMIKVSEGLCVLQLGSTVITNRRLSKVEEEGGGGRRRRGEGGGWELWMMSGGRGGSGLYMCWRCSCSTQFQVRDMKRELGGKEEEKRDGFEQSEKEWVATTDDKYKVWQQPQGELGKNSWTMFKRGL